jgi:stage II sporulation protein D
MVRFLWVALLSTLYSGAPAADLSTLDIGILVHHKPTAVQVIVEFGVYNVVADGTSVITIRSRERVSVSQKGNLLELSVPGRVVGQYKNIKLKARESDGVFRLYLLAPRKDERVYDDDLHLLPNGNSMKLINRVDLEKYVAGVVEAETGKEKQLEFYKVQAVISRTYALSNSRKHLHEGFNLNDQVDCQVYHGKCRWVPEIIEAVEMTSGKVLVDSEMKLITAAFHSSSGGETVPSDWVWTLPLPYLNSRKDEFSQFGAHYAWNVTISKESWLSYLERKYGYKTSDALLRQLATNYEQPNRQSFFLDPIFKMPLKEIRKDWKLNSTYFDIISQGDSIRISGRGFGHGTGLSQEGAMRMAEIGFTYTDILHFYYSDVHIIDLAGLSFYRQ